MTDVSSSLFSFSYAGNESGNQDVVLNAGAHEGFVLNSIVINWEPVQMSGQSAELPMIAISKYAGAASGGTSGSIFNHTEPATAVTSALVSPTTLGSSGTPGANVPQVWPGYASISNDTGLTGYYQHGGLYRWDFNGWPIEVGSGNSLWVRVANCVSVTLFFSEHRNP